MIKKTKPSLSVVPCTIDNVSRQLDNSINNTLLKDNEILYSGSLDDIITVHKSVLESTNVIEMNSQIDLLINKLIEDGILELGDYFGYDITQFNLSENVNMDDILSFQSTLNLGDDSKISYSNNIINSDTFWSLDNIKRFFGLEYVLLNNNHAAAAPPVLGERSFRGALELRRGSESNKGIQHVSGLITWALNDFEGGFSTTWHRAWVCV